MAAPTTERAGYRRASWWNRATFRAFWLVVGGAVRVVFRLRVENRPRLRGPAVVVANHGSFLDPIVLGAASWRRIRFMMASMHYDSPRANWFYRWHRAISVSLIGANRESLREARASLDAGEVVGVFPEGGLSRDGDLILGNPGAVALVLGADVPIVPCAILGAHEALGPGRALRLHKVTVRFGRPIPASELAPADASRKERLAIATRRIMTEIAELAGTRAREDVLDELASSKAP